MIGPPLGLNGHPVLAAMRHLNVSSRSVRNHRWNQGVYPVLFIDAIVVKVRAGRSPNRSIYVAIGVTVNGEC
jgi:hypothetical protein